MTFVADESLDFPIVTALRGAGHDVYSIKEQSPRMDDDKILKIANEQKRILLTCDKDFGELVFRLKLVSSGHYFTPHAGTEQSKESGNNVAVYHAA